MGGWVDGRGCMWKVASMWWVGGWVAMNKGLRWLGGGET